jgi:hypothetical protein
VGFEENPEAWFETGAVDVEGVHVPQVCGVDEDGDFFFGFAGGSGKDGFAGFEFAGREVPPVVEVGVRVAPPSEEHLIVSDDEYVHIDEVTVGHRWWCPRGRGA